MCVPPFLTVYYGGSSLYIGKRAGFHEKAGSFTPCDLYGALPEGLVAFGGRRGRLGGLLGGAARRDRRVLLAHVVAVPADRLEARLALRELSANRLEGLLVG